MPSRFCMYYFFLEYPGLPVSNADLTTSRSQEGHVQQGHRLQSYVCDDASSPPGTNRNHLVLPQSPKKPELSQSRRDSEAFPCWAIGQKTQARTNGRVSLRKYMWCRDQSLSITSFFAGVAFPRKSASCYQGSPSLDRKS